MSSMDFTWTWEGRGIFKIKLLEKYTKTIIKQYNSCLMIPSLRSNINNTV